MHRLEPSAYEKVRPVFGDWARAVLHVTAVIQGDCAGEIYVDDLVHPQAAYMVSGDGHYLAGKPDRAAFIHAVNGALPSDDYFVLFYQSSSWEDQFATILKGTYAVKTKRRYYTLRLPRVADWRDRVPAGYTMRRIDAELLAHTQLKNCAALREGIEEEWCAIEPFLERGFGFCLLHDDEIVSWCGSDYVSGDHCEIGINTDWSYRRKGFGTLTVAATVDYAAQRFALIGWHCWDNNVGSIGVAENAGFELAQVYSIYINHWVAENITDMSREEFRAFAEYYAGELEADPPVSGFPLIVTAKAWSLAGQHERAIRYMHRAIDIGWLRDRAHLENIWPELFIFHVLDDVPGSEALMARL